MGIIRNVGNICIENIILVYFYLNKYIFEFSKRIHINKLSWRTSSREHEENEMSEYNNINCVLCFVDSFCTDDFGLKFKTVKDFTAKRSNKRGTGVERATAKLVCIFFSFFFFQTT